MAIFQKVGENLLHLWFARVNEGLFCKLYRSKTEKQQKKWLHDVHPKISARQLSTQMQEKNKLKNVGCAWRRGTKNRSKNKPCFKKKKTNKKKFKYQNSQTAVEKKTKKT